MRLLNTTTLRLESFFGSWTGVPEYAILSHAWGHEEILFDDIRDPREPLPVHKKGFAKLKGSCDQARRDGYRYMWNDTCCIDKSSSAELSEAINSMFKWYHQSQRCYVYLVDVNVPGEGGVPFERSRWFTRGWTLQELIAPRDVWFYDCNWSFIGRRQFIKGESSDCHDLAEAISERTGIPMAMLRWYRYLQRPARKESHLPSPISYEMYLPDIKQAEVQLLAALRSFSIAQKMSWAARRVTTRTEDEAYSLLGVFEVNMPLLYGEGSRAFFRLQQETLRVSNDQSILAFQHLVAPTNMGGRSPLLADSPRCFADSPFEHATDHAPMWPDAPRGRCAPELLASSKALEIGLCLCPLSNNGDDGRYYVGILGCAYRDDVTSHPAIFLEEIDGNNLTYCRVAGHILRRVTPLDMGDPVPNPRSPEELQPDLNQACFTVIGLNFHPPEQHIRLPKFSDFSLFGIIELVLGMRITLGNRESRPLQAWGAYPQFAQVVDGSQLYIPSLTTPAWQKQQAHHHGGRTQERLNASSPFGVVILRIYPIGEFVVSWGELPRAQSPWFAIFSWAKLAAACELNHATDMDLVTAAKLVFEKQASWIKFIDSPIRPVIEEEFPSCRIRCRTSVMDFFGRRILDVGISVIWNDGNGGLLTPGG